MGNASDQKFKYWAFVSYSSKDRAEGQWLLNALETYWVPGSLVGLKTGCGTVPARIYPVFRDRDELRAGADLGVALDDALRQSRCLISLCSPNSADPESWVNTEIANFKAMGRERDVLALIVDGEPGVSEGPDPQGRECFPAALRYRVDAEGRLTDERAEPLAADLSREDRSPCAARRKALLKLVARIIDVDFDLLEQRDRRRRRQRTAIWTTAVAALLAAFVGLGLLWYDSDREAMSHQLAGEARQKLADSPDLGALLALLAYRIDPTPAAYGALLAVPDRNPNLATFLHRGISVSAIAISPDNRLAAVGDCTDAGCSTQRVHLYDLGTLQPVVAPAPVVAEAIGDLAFHPDGKRLFVLAQNGGQHQLLTLGLGQPDAPAQRIYRGTQALTSMAISGDGRFYAVAMQDGEYKVFGDQGRKCGDILPGPVRVTAFSDDGPLFAAAVEGEPMVLVEIDGCKTQRLFRSDRIGDLAFAPGGTSLSVIQLDGTITEWDTGKRTEADTYNTTTASPNQYLHAFSRDASLLASLNNRELWIFDLAARRELRERLRSGEVSDIWRPSIVQAMKDPEVARLRGHTGKPRLIRFSRDGSLVLSADDGGTALLWDVNGKSSAVAAEPDDAAEVPAEPATEVTSPDGRLRARIREETEGCSGDYTWDCRRRLFLTLTDTASGLDITTLEADGPPGPHIELSTIAFTGDGKVATGGEMWRTVWHVDPPSLIGRACRVANRALTAAERARYLGWRDGIPWVGAAEACPVESGR